jgi:hypothetical protein
MTESENFWEAAPVSGLKELLAGLRDEVLRRDPKRCPKWGFRLAPTWPSTWAGPAPRPVVECFAPQAQVGPQPAQSLSAQAGAIPLEKPLLDFGRAFWKNRC